MTAVAKPLAGAPSTLRPTLDWKNIDWCNVVAEVRQLQMRIAKAFREGKHGKVKSLQWILTHSFHAKLLAVKRVVTNKGADTPGVDGVTWDSPKDKLKAALSLKRRGYQTKPLKRIYIPKKQKGKLRPLSIPVMECRAQQALYLLSLEPISEMIADKNAYGFRPLRSTADAIQQCFTALARKGAAKYVLEGDIRACFDQISHQWLERNTPMDKEMLRKWLAAGYIEKGKLHPTVMGTPQGGIISPTLLNITLSGLEQAVKAGCPKRGDMVNVCVYADDFIITGVTKALLENKVKPIVQAFLKERGLSLSPEKTKITHINEGFDFLGMNVRKYNNKLIIKPAKSNVKRFLDDIRGIIKRYRTIKTEVLILLLNSKIRGWSNYYRHVCSKATFNYVDAEIFKAIWRWSCRRHPLKRGRWVKQKYFRREKLQNWIFFARYKRKRGTTAIVDLVTMSRVPIVRHIKIRGEATPYNAAYHEYLDKLIAMRKIVTHSTAAASWWLCWWKLFKPLSGNKESRVAKSGLINA